MKSKNHKNIPEDSPDVESLIICNILLKNHLELLQSKLQRTEEQLELCADIISSIDEENYKNVDHEVNIDPTQISLN